MVISLPFLFIFSSRSQDIKSLWTVLTAVSMVWLQTPALPLKCPVCWGTTGPSLGAAPNPRFCPPAAGLLVPCTQVRMPCGKTSTTTSWGSWRRARRQQEAVRKDVRTLLRSRRAVVRGPWARWSSWICCVRKSREWSGEPGGWPSNLSSRYTKTASWNWWPGASGNSSGWLLKVRLWIRHLVSQCYWIPDPVCQKVLMKNND